MATAFTLVPTTEPLLSSSGTTVKRMTSVIARQGAQMSSDVMLIALGNATDTVSGTQDNDGFVGLVQLGRGAESYAVMISADDRQALDAGDNVSVPSVETIPSSSRRYKTSATALSRERAGIWERVLADHRGSGGLEYGFGAQPVLGATDSGPFQFSTAHLKDMYLHLPTSLPVPQQRSRPSPIAFIPVDADDQEHAPIASPVRSTRRALAPMHQTSKTPPDTSWLDTLSKTAKRATSHAASLAGKMARAATGRKVASQRAGGYYIDVTEPKSGGTKRRGVTRRGTKRRGTKRRGTKRRGTKRRGTKRRATEAGGGAIVDLKAFVHKGGAKRRATERRATERRGTKRCRVKRSGTTGGEVAEEVLSGRRVLMTL